MNFRFSNTEGYFVGVLLLQINSKITLVSYMMIVI